MPCLPFGADRQRALKKTAPAAPCRGDSTHISARGDLAIAEEDTSRTPLERAREERDAAASRKANEAEQARADEAEQVQEVAADARDRAEAMGDVVEQGTSGTADVDDASEGTQQR